jgi:hypothetical protein
MLLLTQLRRGSIGVLGFQYIPKTPPLYYRTTRAVRTLHKCTLPSRQCTLASYTMSLLPVQSEPGFDEKDVPDAETDGNSLDIDLNTCYEKRIGRLVLDPGCVWPIFSFRCLLLLITTLAQRGTR